MANRHIGKSEVLDMLSNPTARMYFWREGRRRFVVITDGNGEVVEVPRRIVSSLERDGKIEQMPGQCPRDTYWRLSQ